MREEDLSQFGKSIKISDKGIRKQEKIIFRILRQKVGIFRCIAIKLELRKKIEEIKKQFPTQIEKNRKIGQNLDKQLLLIAALFFVLANNRGRKFAIDFISRLMKSIAPVTILVIYQLGELVQCEGDVFENYKKYNRALFTELNSIGACKNIIFQETNDLLEVKMLSCFIINFFHAVGCEEIATLACELFLAGYSLIEEATQSEFRRQCTPAKGEENCFFQFYRKGTAPDNVHLKK